MSITFKEKLTAIRGSIEKWDKISKGEMEDERSANCPLCQMCGDLTACDNCPIYEKTGEEQCNGTPYIAWSREQTSENARDFRDWLKDLYIEVSEAGDGSEKEKPIEIEIAPLERRAYMVEMSSALKERVEKLEERIKKLGEDILKANSWRI